MREGFFLSWHFCSGNCLRRPSIVHQLITALDEIRQEIESGKFDWRIDLEDVHMNIESRLVEKIGEPGKKLHTGRSRNDQVATDIRLFIREQIDSCLLYTSDAADD